MSSRYGMADGRCFTATSSNSLMNAELAKKAGFSPMDSSSMRKFLQSEAGAKLVMEIVQPKQCLGTTGLRV